MYLKYSVLTGTRAQIQNEIGDLLTGVISQNNTVYGTAVVDGTGPTAGTYTRTSTATDKHLAFTKKHAQYNAVSMPAEMTIKVFGGDASEGNTSYKPTLQIGDKLGANNMGELWPGDFVNTSGRWNAATTGSEYHFIFNDTTFVMQSIAPQETGANAQAYAGTIWSDFEVNAYDEYAIGENPLYYPGCAVVHTAADPLNASTGSYSYNFFGAWRFQYQNQYNATFANATMSTSKTEPDALIGGNVLRSAYTRWGTYPVAHLPFWNTWGPSGTAIATIPLQMDGVGMRFNSGSQGSETANGIDARYHNVMLNSYRISNDSGFTGDYMESSDNTRFYMFVGHRMPYNPEPSNKYAYVDRQALYAFPSNNVTMP
jgi:hypothetical protein